jgi:uncharacterized integral membrane protein (TIGR00698 family)
VISATTLAATLAAGALLARWLQVERTTGKLISAGTAICGGSAIAALGPVLGAAARPMSVALGCVFVLNAVALFVFPALGQAFGLSSTQFGYWAAIAIHDTSSVVGAAARYSPDALAVALPVKLARALWILPLVAWTAWREQRVDGSYKWPWFVLFFVAASACATAFPAGEELYAVIVRGAKAGLAVTLFLIGASLSPESVRSVGWRPFTLGVLLWLLVSVGALAVILIVS